MNQSQIKYARERLSSLKYTHETTLTKKHTTDEIKLSMDEKILALKAGRFTFNREMASWRWYDGVKFTQERSQTVNSEALKADKAKLDIEFTRLMDQLILGDAEGALQALGAFAEWKP